MKSQRRVCDLCEKGLDREGIIYHISIVDGGEIKISQEEYCSPAHMRKWSTLVGKGKQRISYYEPAEVEQEN